MTARPAILVADDDESIRALARAMLEREGYDVIEAREGGEVLQALLDRPDIAAIALDWVMDGMDGIETLRCLANRDDAPPVLMMTVKSSDEEVREALDAGAVDYVTKPLKRGELAFKIGNLLRVDRDRAKIQAARRQKTGLAAKASMIVSGVDRDGVRLETSFPIPAGAVFVLESRQMNLHLDLPLEDRYAVRAETCEGGENRYRVRARFVSLPPAVREKIAEALRGGLGL